MTPRQKRIEKTAFNLRMAALAFGKCIYDPVATYSDHEARIIHRKLQRAAIRYADTVNRYRQAKR